MSKVPNLKIMIILTLILCLFIIISSLSGVFFEKELYSMNVPAYIVQSVGTDIGNLFVIVPILLLSIIFLYRNSKKAFIIWFGTMMYALYLFIYNCFTLHFNHLFLIYCAELGLTLYSLFIAIASLNADSIKSWFSLTAKTTGTIIYLLILGSFFIIFWLSDVIPASIGGTLPKSAADLGLITASFHALDLGVFFPGFLFSAFLLYKKNGFGYLLAPAFLVFAVIMTLCLVFLVIVTALRGLGFILTDVLLFGSAAVTSGIILMNFLKHCIADK